MVEKIQVGLREETLPLTAQVALTKMPRNEAKIYQETDFRSTEGHLLASSGYFLTLTSSLDVVQVRFALVAFFCELSIKSLSFYSFANVEWLQLSSSNYDMQVLRTSCWGPLRVLLHSTDGILKLTFSTGILSCRGDQHRHFSSVNSSLTYVFHLADFVDISYLHVI